MDERPEANPYDPPEGRLEEEARRPSWLADLLAGLWLLLLGRSVYVILFYEPSPAVPDHGPDQVGTFFATLLPPYLGALAAALVRALACRSASFRGALIGSTLALPMVGWLVFELWRA